MRFSIAVFASFFSFSLLAQAVALPPSFPSASLKTRYESALNEVRENTLLDKRARKIKVIEKIQGRKRGWLLGAKPDPTDDNRKKTDQELAHELAELALAHFGARSGAIT